MNSPYSPQGGAGAIIFGASTGLRGNEFANRKAAVKQSDGLQVRANRRAIRGFCNCFLFNQFSFGG
jgi:hypothetical protein